MQPQLGNWKRFIRMFISCGQIEWKRQKHVATHDVYRATNQLRMAARRTLEWIGTFEGLVGF